MLQIMLKLGMPETFVDMVSVLFGDTSASVSEDKQL